MPPPGGALVIRGLVYLTGFVTLALVACVAAVAHKVHEWPWGEYVREGSDLLADKLDPRDTSAARGEGSGGRGVAEPTPAEDLPKGDGEGRRREDFARPAEAARPLRHTVRRGETLYALARRYYHDPLLWRVIARANDIRSPADMRVGRVLVIPASRPDVTRAADAGARDRDDDRPYDLRLAITPALVAEETHAGGGTQ